MTTITLTEAELRDIESGKRSVDDILDSSGDNGFTRRALLAAVAATAGGAIGVGGSQAFTTDATANTSYGQLFTEGDPGVAYLSTLNGPITGPADEITQLYPMIVEEDTETVNPDGNTLVFRYEGE